ncbi:MAG: MFS transporter [Syntrophomonadaceae bacterium]|nr:MFS transporter [Syntrophomonadaceae bacterium]
MASENKTAGKFVLNQRQKLLLPVVMIGAFFEGFDFMVVNLALPYIKNAFGLTEQTAAYTLSAIAVGALVAFFVVRMADKIGRRPIFIWSVIIYSVFSLLTASSVNLAMFVSFQFIARVFLVVCWAVGFIIVAEEFDTEYRGRALGFFQGAAAIGAIFPSLLLPLVSMIPFLHWRGLYIIGALPLLLLLFYAKNLPETQRFMEMKAGKGENAPSLFAVFAAPYRKNLFAIMALWFCMYLSYASAMNFFALRVEGELGWNENQVGLVTALAFTIGLTGYVAVGKLLDMIGRKKTAYIFFGLGSLSVMMVFQAQSFLQVALAQIIGVFFIGTFTVLCATFTNELFPTELRGNVTAWGNNIVGRLGQIAAPALVGFLSAPLLLNGIGNAVTLMACGTLLCVLIVAIFLPEPMTFQITEYKPDIEDETVIKG